jgi:hypothetical protein
MYSSTAINFLYFFNFFAVLEYALPFTEFYRRNDENIIVGAFFLALQRERKDSVQPLKKPTANRNTYSRAGKSRTNTMTNTI